ncbi:MAG: hypothetical protein ACI3XR_07805, partial [Eubacteriales bacterium]
WTKTFAQFANHFSFFDKLTHEVRTPKPTTVQTHAQNDGTSPSFFIPFCFCPKKTAEFSKKAIQIQKCMV